MRRFLIAANAIWATVWTVALAQSLHTVSMTGCITIVLVAVTFMFTAIELLRK